MENDNEPREKIFTTSELVFAMLSEACGFIEFYSEGHVSYYKAYGYAGPFPKKFQPSSADKMILRKLIENRVEQIPEEYRIEHNIPAFAQRVLFWDYYPAYNPFNASNDIE